MDSTIPFVRLTRLTDLQVLHYLLAKGTVQL